MTDPDSASGDLDLFRQLLEGRRLRERSRRQLRNAIEHAKNNDGWAVVIQTGPGAAGKPDVLYAGTSSIRDVILGSMTQIFPPAPGQRDGRTSGR